MSALAARELSFELEDATPSALSAILRLPRSARGLLVLAHGAGAGMRHPFLESVAERLADRQIGSLRYQFPYMERGSRRPDARPRLVKTVRAAVACAAREAPGVPLFAGGKSMGGRMTSMAASEAALPGVCGIIFLGFPLHASGKPDDTRGEHLFQVDVPMLFLQGTRDRLAELGLMKPLCQKLGARAALHVVEGGDHSFKVLKRSGRTDHEALDELADVAHAWMARLLGEPF